MDLRTSPQVGRLSSHGRERLQRLLPMILKTVAGKAGETVALGRIIQLVESVATRSVYLSLLSEQPQALRHLARLVAASPWISNSIVRHPVLLDELLDPRALYTPPDANALNRRLQALMEKHDQQDLDKQMDSLRRFRQSEVLRVAASDITGHLPLPEVSNHLSWIAEAVLQAAYKLAWQNMIERHGCPRYLLDGQSRPAHFAIIAYGKLGGLELGYGSDLDLVFLHDSTGTDQATDGVQSVDNLTFFTRLGQRLIHILTTLTPAGVAYEVDMRLRPSGASGLLVSSVSAFEQYQREQAWTWEHQALVRGRFVAGADVVGRAFERIRTDVLARSRDRPRLRTEVVEMRERMRAEHASTGASRFDIKHDPGGITDIEFMVQYGVLAYAAEYPALLTWTDNKRLLEVFRSSGILAAADCDALREAYFSERDRIHRCALQEVPAIVPSDEFEAERRKVVQIWNQFVIGKG